MQIVSQSIPRRGHNANPSNIAKNKNEKQTNSQPWYKHTHSQIDKKDS